MTRLRSREFAASVGVAGLALVFLALHLPFLPKSLEDLDSINFALGLRHFDVAHHQPHPPGYPVYIALAKGAHALIPDAARALGMVSVIAGACGVLAIGGLFRRLRPAHHSGGWTAAATAVAMTSPLYYFTAARPLSDATGLAVATAIQALTIGATSSRALAAAAFAAGLATGIRSQVAWLTVPLLVFRVARPFRVVGSKGPRWWIALSFVAGALLWAVPLVVLSGGPTAYWRVLVEQSSEDLGNIQMLWTRHGARDIVTALYYAFAAPWAAWWTAAFVLVCSATGLVQLRRRTPQTLVWLAVAFVPYLVFDLLFQETFTSRYALPLVIPMAFLAVAGLQRLPREAAILLTIALAMYDAHVGGTSIAVYASQKAPVFRLLDDMRTAAASEPTRPVLAPDRRLSLDLRGPIRWAGDESPSIDRQLAAPPQHEWLEAVNYWNNGGRAPVWFVVDPMRTAIDLVKHDAPTSYRWTLPYPVLMSGVRPNEMDWYRVSRPEWYVAEGWALTPEAAGVAEADRRGMAYGPIEAWVSRDAHDLLIGGRNFESTPERVTVDIGAQATVGFVAEPGAFVQWVPLPASSERPPGDRKITIHTLSPARVAVEQFDASSGRPLMGFGVGWHEQEFNPRTGDRWRWLAERGEILYRALPSTVHVTLHVEGEASRRYFPRASRLTVRSGAQVLYSGELSSDFSLTIPVPRSPDPIVLETDQTYVPAERSWRGSADRRRLGLRIFKCELRPGQP